MMLSSNAADRAVPVSHLGYERTGRHPTPPRKNQHAYSLQPPRMRPQSLTTAETVTKVSVIRQVSMTLPDL